MTQKQKNTPKNYQRGAKRQKTPQKERRKRDGKAQETRKKYEKTKK